ncbi:MULTISPECIES: cytochrome c oxidase subunit 4 [unclassified Agreia]|uniref:cytochrome c oxidase subunit 4 n=1 Tax=unclassified Agreia TaxID=2641148 RepID=UPI0006F45AE3|nr:MULTISPECIES: cytochrome c oxidase subunit 4 [Microbacteriaceae]KQM58563.1 cytochrome c oxidase subunit IV [Agreia sp. Leaf210]KQR21942.1 cytochrome c oxidase subunit IV [Agreia sp. Leaf335]PPF63716.1 cytochrome c oxidase subunit 4 [Clavibacter michiganensis]
MRANKNLFWILAVFCLLLSAVYIFWHILDQGNVEWVGALGIGLAGVLSAFLAFYLGRVFSAQGGDLPEDRLDSDIDDGDPEMGFYSPWSWWPVILAGSASLMLLGFAVGTWITFIGVALVLVAIVGWVYEYYRGYFAR